VNQGPNETTDLKTMRSLRDPGVEGCLATLAAVRGQNPDILYLVSAGTASHETPLLGQGRGHQCPPRWRPRGRQTANLWRIPHRRI